MAIVNLTPHAITFIRDDGEHLTFPPSGTVARVTQVDAEAPDVYGMPAVTRRLGEPIDLPDADADGETTYIVSILVLGATSRKDCVSPDTGPGSVVRDDDGRIVGVRRWVRTT